MKKILLSACMLFGITAGAQVVNFTDVNFKNRMLQANTENYVARDSNSVAIVVDTNGDSEIQVSEALTVCYLDLGAAGISDAAGIEAFQNLRGLSCHGNPGLLSLDLTPLSNLEYFSCDDGTGLENLTFAGLTNLKDVFIMGSNLSTINLTGVTGMLEFSLQDVPVTNLDFSEMVNVTSISLSGTNLVNINLENSPVLTKLRCYNNALLETINVKNGGLLFFGQSWQYGSAFVNNLNLDFICVDEGEEDLFLNYFEDVESTAPNMSTDCNATGGEYNSISGIIKSDHNNNGCDANDLAANYVKVKITEGTSEKIKFTNLQGGYYALEGQGSYTISVETENDMFTYAPSPATVDFPGMNGTEHIQDFCLVSNGVKPDAEMILVPRTPARPGFDAHYLLILINKGNQVLSGSVTFNFDDSLTDFVVASPVQTSSAAGTLSWNYTDLLPFQNMGFEITLNVNAPTETPAVNIGDHLYSSVSVTSSVGDDYPENNNIELDQIVTGSFDPNNIICLQGDIEDPAAIGDYLHYVINFENIGDEAASFVVVTQEIDETMYDMSSFELLNTSHNVDATIVGNAVEFRFNDINLGADQTGNIVYKIKTLQSLEEGDQVMNAADIVFDYNIPIPTNEAVTTFEATMGAGEFATDNSVKIYPNPSNGLVKIDADTEIKAIYLYDIQGRQLQVNNSNQTNVVFDVSDRDSGIYFIKVITEKGIKVDKLIRE